MHNLRNLTNSPYSLGLADGTSVMLPARGELIGVEVHPLHIQSLRASGYIQVADSPAKKPKKPSENPSTERTQAQKDGKDGGGKK